MRREIRAAVAIAVLCAVPLALAKTDRAEVFTGRVEISTTDTGRVQLALDGSRGPGEPDGLADHLFILQREAGAEGMSCSLESARVLFAADRLRITAPDFELWLVVGSEAEQENQPSRGGRTVFGYGLSHHFGGFDSPIESLAARDYFEAVEAEFSQKFLPDGGGGVFCDAGGVGATDCSVGGCSGLPSECSVSCSGGRHACCNCTKATCKCFFP